MLPHIFYHKIRRMSTESAPKTPCAPCFLYFSQPADALFGCFRQSTVTRIKHDTFSTLDRSGDIPHLVPRETDAPNSCASGGAKNVTFCTGYVCFCAGRRVQRRARVVCGGRNSQRGKDVMLYAGKAGVWRGDVPRCVTFCAGYVMICTGSPLRCAFLHRVCTQINIPPPSG